MKLLTINFTDPTDFLQIAVDDTKAASFVGALTAGFKAYAFKEPRYWRFAQTKEGTTDVQMKSAVDGEEILILLDHVTSVNTRTQSLIDTNVSQIEGLSTAK